MNIIIDYDKRTLDDAIKGLSLSAKELEIACKRAVSSTARWFRTEVVKVISKDLGIAQKVIKQRTRVFKINDLTSKIFHGLKQISLSRLNPKQNKKGVGYGLRGSLKRDSAFIIQQGSGKKPVFKRTGKFSIASKGRYAGQKREEIEKQYYEISESASKKIQDLIEGPLMDKFIKNLQTESRKWAIQRA